MKLPLGRALLKGEMLSTFRKTYQMNNAESVRQFQPRVALWQPWDHACNFTEDATLKGLRRRPLHRNPVATPSELRRNKCEPYPQGFKANPGLELANAFSVKEKSPAMKTNSACGAGDSIKPGVERSGTPGTGD